MNIQLKSKVTRDERGMHLVSVDATVNGQHVGMRYTISTGTSRTMADRLCRAIDAGAVFTDFNVLTDVNGKPYLNSHCRVLGRRLNADLINIGY